MARWSSGQDGGLSRRKREFDSPTGHHFSGKFFLTKERESITIQIVAEAKALVMIVGVD